MSVSISIVNEATPFVQKVSLALNGGDRMNRAIANAALPVFQGHFRVMAATNRNPYGVRSSFWNRMLSGTKPVATTTEAAIRMPREMALRYFGGTVTPKKSKFLAIPARAESVNKSPRDFSDLRFAILPVGGPVLIQNEQRQLHWRKRKGQMTLVPGEAVGGGVYFWLRRSATIRGDRDVLPKEADVMSAVRTGLTSYLAFQGRKKS